MKKITTIAIAFLLIAGTSFAQEWTLDKAHSQVGFSVVHNSVSELGGTFGGVTAKFNATKEDFSDATIELSADVQYYQHRQRTTQ